MITYKPVYQVIVFHKGMYFWDGVSKRTYDERSDSERRILYKKVETKEKKLDGIDICINVVSYGSNDYDWFYNGIAHNDACSAFQSLVEYMEKLKNVLPS